MTERLAGRSLMQSADPKDAAGNGELPQCEQRHELPGQQTALHWQTHLDSGDMVSVLVRRSAINVLLNNEQPSYTFDPLGRLHGAFIDGVNYRRSLDNRVLSKWTEHRPGARERRRRWLTRAEAQAWVDFAYRLIPQLERQAGSAPPPVRAALERLAQWDWAALEADRQRFEQIYTPVGILPPDQYLALVLQATHGCSHNACTFCTFYRDVRFRIKTAAEFRQHVAAVCDFFGSALAMRRSIFLADANALVIPMPRLRELLQVVSDALQPAGGESPPATYHLPLFAFIDAFHVERKSLADWQELAAHGLRRVYIGMESGHDPLLRWLNKPGDAADVLEAVTTLKAAGVHVSVIIMLGVGGDRFAAGHVADTVQLLNAMPLGRGDLIYFSDFVQHPDAPYAALAAGAGVHPLDETTLRLQEATIRTAFVPCDPQHPPQFSRYDINEFIY